MASDGPVDLTILHVNGRHDHATRRAQKIKEQGNQYAVIQYVLQSCRNPNPKDWLELWDGAKCVWSYYDLLQYIPNQYHAPLAADPQVFYPVQAEKKWLIGSNGNAFEAECIGEVQLAAYQAGGRAVHVGPTYTTSPVVDYFQNVPDAQLRDIYNGCQWFSALRRRDGFEMVAVEALLCGVRPIMFDTPNYRQWFDGLVEFLPETLPGELTGRIKHLIKREPRPVTDAEREETASRFNWTNIINGFWERCLN